MPLRLFVRLCVKPALEQRRTPAALIEDVLNVARGAVGFPFVHVTSGASCSRCGAVQRLKRVVAARTRQSPFGVTFHTRCKFYALIVQRVKLIAPPLVIRVRGLARRPQLS